jgi:ArsR family transcriptional regulator
MFKGSIASRDLEEVVRALKSAAEPTRLRLLAVLIQGELTVGELCTVLGQSQPRISRHLRLLTEAGFLDRFREQRCVYYRLPAQGRRLEWLRQLLSLIDPGAPTLLRDRERAGRVVADRASVAALQLGATAADDTAAAPKRDLAAVLLEEIGPTSIGELLDIGTGAGLMLQILGPRARHAVGIDSSSPVLRVARGRLRGSGLNHCEFRHGDMYELPYPDHSFDTVTIDRVLARAKRPEAALVEAARMLRPEGRLIIVEDFDQFDAATAGHPFSQLRRWLEHAGLDAGRLRPCDLAERHFIVALARHKSHSEA